MEIFCELCRRSLKAAETFVVPDGDQWHYVCPNCNAALNSCSGCTFGNECLFETANDPLPKTIVQRTQTPMGFMQAQIKNPEREAKYCSTCRCGVHSESYEEKDRKPSCGKQFGYCKRISSIYQTPSWIKEEEEE